MSRQLKHAASSPVLPSPLLQSTNQNSYKRRSRSTHLGSVYDPPQQAGPSGTRAISQLAPNAGHYTSPIAYVHMGGQGPWARPAGLLTQPGASLRLQLNPNPPEIVAFLLNTGCQVGNRPVRTLSSARPSHSNRTFVPIDLSKICALETTTADGARQYWSVIRGTPTSLPGNRLARRIVLSQIQAEWARPMPEDRTRNMQGDSGVLKSAALIYRDLSHGGTKPSESHPAAFDTIHSQDRRSLWFKKGKDYEDRGYEILSVMHKSASVDPPDWRSFATC